MEFVPEQVLTMMSHAKLTITLAAILALSTAPGCGEVAASDPLCLTQAGGPVSGSPCLVTRAQDAPSPSPTEGAGAPTSAGHLAPAHTVAPGPATGTLAEDAVCSYRVSCEQDLMASPRPPYAPGPTLVTAFACDRGRFHPAGASAVRFEGSLCCDTAREGDPRCTTLTADALTGAAVWSRPGVGVLDTRSYVADLGTSFHNTSWRLDPAAVTDSCVFRGSGQVASNATRGASTRGARSFAFSATITAVDSEGAMRCGDARVDIVQTATERPGTWPSEPGPEDPDASSPPGHVLACGLDVDPVTYADMDYEHDFMSK